MLDIKYVKEQCLNFKYYSKNCFCTSNIFNFIFKFKNLINCLNLIGKLVISILLEYRVSCTEYRVSSIDTSYHSPSDHSPPPNNHNTDHQTTTTHHPLPTTHIPHHLSFQPHSINKPPSIHNIINNIPKNNPLIISGWKVSYL